MEHWLTERYCLYALSPDGRLSRNEVHHAPWPLQSTEAEIRENTLLDSFGISVGTTRPILHFSSQLDVVVWNASEVEKQRKQILTTPACNSYAVGIAGRKHADHTKGIHRF